MKGMSPASILLVKLSSLGDVLHTLPALSDAQAAFPGIKIDWVIEQAFAEIPGWHPAVERTIVLPHRAWRKQPLQALTTGAVVDFVNKLRAVDYEWIIDAQGLLGKSAWVGWLAKGRSVGLSWSSAREPLASLCYRRRIAVPRELHAVERLRTLFAEALGYRKPESSPDYGLRRQHKPTEATPRRLMFLHGTTWSSKQWPQPYWAELIRMAGDAGYDIRLTWGDSPERTRALALARGCQAVKVLGRLDLTGIARELAAAAAVVTVDTGLGHLAAALGVPAVALYGPTSALRTGTYGKAQRHLVADYPCSPCFARTCRYRGTTALDPPCLELLTPERVWTQVQELLAARV